MYIDLESKTLSELIMLREIFSGTVLHPVYHNAFAKAIFVPYERMSAHTARRGAAKVKRFYK